jgi:hypothetical protein
MKYGMLTHKSLGDQCWLALFSLAATSPPTVCGIAEASWKDCNTEYGVGIT